jgi:signal transduction histidine kinase
MPPPLTTRAELTARARSLVERPWSHRRPWLYAASDAGLALYAAILWAAGYPQWRVGAVAAVVIAWIAIHVHELRARSASSGQAIARRAYVTEWAMLTTGFVAVAVTGGLRSPLLPGAVAALPLRIFQYGWTARTKLHWATTALGVAAVALLAPAWTGPRVGDALYWAVAAGTVLIVGGATVIYLALLTRVAHDSVREASRAREELTLQAIARARELEQLGAQLSHELKNPLSAIKTLVQLSTRAAQDPASRERLEVVESEIRRMQQILQDYLSFSRPLEKLRPQELQLAGIVDEVFALLAGRAAEAGIVLRFHGDARVTADPLRLKEALLNLLVNALEASPSGGRVEVEITNDGAGARVVVRDFGRGMPDEVLARIGTPFFTTREEGTGLGVALARATFVRHGGTLEYASQPDEGTTATATLPALAAARRTDGARARGG